jgi:hypothetical protein
MNPPDPDPAASAALPGIAEDDAALRAALRAALAAPPPDDPACRRVELAALSQWRAHQAGIGAGAPLTALAGLGVTTRSATPAARWLAIAVLATLLGVAAWGPWRGDPAISELAQPDVLSQWSLGTL